MFFPLILTKPCKQGIFLGVGLNAGSLFWKLFQKTPAGEWESKKGEGCVPPRVTTLGSWGAVSGQLWAGIGHTPE